MKIIDSRFSSFDTIQESDGRRNRLKNFDVTKYRTARTAYTARTGLRVDLHGE